MPSSAAAKPRSPLRTFIRWLPVIATVILAAFTVLQAFGKMAKQPAESTAATPTSTVEASGETPGSPRQ